MMPYSKTLYLYPVMVICIVAITMEACKKDDYQDIDCNTINASFMSDINRIIRNNCIQSGCHNSGSLHGDFSNYAGVKGKVNNGSIEKRVLIKKDMPNSRPLSLDERKKIKCWLNNGAPQN